MIDEMDMGTVLNFATNEPGNAAGVLDSVSTRSKSVISKSAVSKWFDYLMVKSCRAAKPV